ncbi:replication protein [Rahnella sp. PD12R]|uniref:replication protein n=1 Tax=Rahnella sp. PD12R TaxID=2855688 RepID=UPI001C470D4A|nr:replication protein [Rahnella sp. PD12R]MBV6817545.1 replication protein [Rahnella sp. PD12R]
MDNQKLGYVPLYRSIKKKSWAKDVYLRTLWEDLLLGAQRKPRTVNFKGNQWNLQAGQLVVTAADLGLSLCDREGKPTSRDAVGRMLNFFAKEGMISMDGEKRKGTVITILNYAEYAEKIDNLPAHKAAHYPAHDEASNGAVSDGGAAHYPALKAAHHEQEGNNKNINNKPPLSPLDEKKSKRATQFPTDFSPTAGNTKLANTLGVDLQNELDAFTDYHKSKGSTYKDWGLAFNTWIRNAIKFGKPATKRTGVAQPAKPSNHIPEGFQ